MGSDPNPTPSGAAPAPSDAHPAPATVPTQPGTPATPVHPSPPATPVHPSPPATPVHPSPPATPVHPSPPGTPMPRLPAWVGSGWTAPAGSTPSWISKRWPGPAGGASRPVLIGVAVAAAVSAASLPLTRPGVGWLLGGVAGTAALAIAARPGTGPADARPATAPAAAPGPTPSTGPARVPTGGWRRIGWTRPLWAAAIVALLGVGAIRSAGWLFALCLLTAGCTAMLTVADGRSVRGLLLSTIVPPTAVFRSIPWLVSGLTRPAGSGGGRPVGRTLASLAVSLGLLVVFGLLFSSADAAFARLLTSWLPELSVPTLLRWIFVFGAVGAGLLSAAYVLTAPPDLPPHPLPPKRRLRRTDWLLPVVALDALFAGFVAVQITTLFGGSKHVLRTAGLSYAEYARRGFWQLLAVTVLTLLVIAAAARWAPRESRTDRTLVRALLGGLTLLTLVVVASALFRMDVYADAYGATRLRLLVAVCEVWLGLLFVLTALAGVRLAAGWLPRAAVGTAVLALLALAMADPDRLIAEHNVDRYERTGRIDVSYLSTLSTDAVPALDRLPEPERTCALRRISLDLPADDWRETNLARSEARRILARRPPDALRTCPPDRMVRAAGVDGRRASAVGAERLTFLAGR
ncbi:DUF4153 domain-containing protein [Plantactinospora sp. WMMB334]|uniref:DUF4153 domain-containing protein n=1 Tax=Plantactinospora sp. WMMB334 TaxID=3404119 RepID=UPI003B93F18A